MAYRLEAGEPLADGLRRCLLEELDRAATLLGDPSPAEPDESIHESRKALKRARTVVRLLRPVLGAERSRAASTRLRDAGRVLAATRDAAVLVACLDAVTGQAASGRFSGLRARLVRERSEARRLALRASGPRAEALERVMAGRADSARWELGAGLEQRVVVGVKRVYRKGRRRLRAAREHPDAGTLHAWRKRVKDLGYTFELLAPAWPETLEPAGDELRRLWELLGEHHDLHVLTVAAGERASAFETPDERAVLAELLAARAADLERRALALGERVYTESPGAFRKRMAGYLTAWRAEAAADDARAASQIGAASPAGPAPPGGAS